jgi:hypothetical protein
MAASGSHRPVILEARVRSQAIHYGICIRKNDTGMDFSPNSCLAG